MEDRGGRFNDYDDLRNNIRSNESFDDLRNNLRSNDSYDLRNQIRTDNFNDFNRESRNADYAYGDRMQNNAGMRNNDFGDDMRLHARMMEDEMDEMRAFNDRMDQGGMQMSNNMGGMMSNNMGMGNNQNMMNNS